MTASKAKRKKKKRKRAKPANELDRLWRAGLYWEWLAKIEQDGLIEQRRGDWEKVWQRLIRSALRNPHQLSRFVDRYKTLEQRPSLPDLEFLECLEQAVRGEKFSARLKKLTGLSPPARLLKSRLLQWGRRGFRGKRVTRFLTDMVTKPLQITPRFYNELAALISSPTQAMIVRELASLIKVVRRLNHKNTVRRGLLSGNLQSNLGMADGRIVSLCRQLPPALADILLLPFLVQTATAMGRMAESGELEDLFYLLDWMPCLVESLSGRSATELKEELPLEIDPNGCFLDDPWPLIEKIRGQMPQAGFDEKFALFSQVRIQYQRGCASQWSAFAEDDPFADEEDPGKTGEAWCGLLQDAYRIIFKELRGRLPNLPDHERKAISDLFSPLISQDWSLLLDLQASSRESPEILEDLAEVCCGSPSIMLLLLVACASAGNGKGRRRIEERLAALEPVPLDAFRWLLDQCGSILVPHLSSIRPLLERYRERRAVMTLIMGRVCREAESLLDQLMLDRSAPSSLSNLFSMFCGDSDMLQKQGRVLRKELKAVRNLPELEPVRRLMASFDTDNWPMSGYPDWLEYLLENDEELLLEYLATRIEAEAGESGDAVMQFLGLDLPSIPATITCAQAGFLVSHFDLIAGKRPDIIVQYVALLYRSIDTITPELFGDATILVLLHNALQRIRTSDEEFFGKAADQMHELLRRAARSGRPRGRPRKRAGKGKRRGRKR